MRQKIERVLVEPEGEHAGGAPCRLVRVFYLVSRALRSGVQEAVLRPPAAPGC